jgi:hypothetical protein
MSDSCDPKLLRAPKVVWLLALLAAAHVLFFSAAFPFFNAVDEQLHLDLVVRYAHGEIPRALETLRPDSLHYIAFYGTTEYLCPPQSLPGGHVATPPWKLPANLVPARVAATEALWHDDLNHEVSQPPLYYSLAGLWMRLWQGLGFHGGTLLYLVRFFNAVAVVAMVWLGWFAARMIFPDNQFICLAVPAFIAFMPQSIFYAINNDVLCPLAFGLVFILLLQLREQALTPQLASGLGLAMAATFLTKTSNLPLLAVAGLGLAWKIFRDWRRGQSCGGAWLLLLACAGLPMAAWMAWCKIHFGDFTGSTVKILYLGWTNQPVGEWLHHPLFTGSGSWYFLAVNLATFWQGELVWGCQPLALITVDYAYVVLTLGFLGFTLAAWLRQGSALTPPQRAAIGFSFACVAAALAFFALLSVKYDFQTCLYPSRKHPFFGSGRLMLGMLIPFLILFACGLDQLMRKFEVRTRYLVLFSLLAFMLLSEITIDWKVFSDEYNWFHL